MPSLSGPHSRPGLFARGVLRRRTKCAKGSSGFLAPFDVLADRLFALPKELAFIDRLERGNRARPAVRDPSAHDIGGVLELTAATYPSYRNAAARGGSSKPQERFRPKQDEAGRDCGRSPSRTFARAGSPRTRAPRYRWPRHRPTGAHRTTTGRTSRRHEGPF